MRTPAFVRTSRPRGGTSTEYGMLIMILVSGLSTLYHQFGRLVSGNATQAARTIDTSLHGDPPPPGYGGPPSNAMGPHSYTTSSGNGGTVVTYQMVYPGNGQPGTWVATSHQ